MWLCLLLTAASMPARATPVPYTLDQRYAAIGFTTSGLIGTQGYFQKFSGHLALDFQAPEHSTVNVTVDAQAITLSFPPGVGMLRSPDYFDTKDFP
jgi:polyisoprenoid-binding protein YceI